MNALGGLRVLALVLLAALALFIVASPVAPRLRNAVFDQYQRLFPLERGQPKVTVVLIDENSIARLGQWPWPRSRMAELIQHIAAHEPLAIGLDLMFPEPDRFAPAAIAAENPRLPEVMRRELERLPSTDARFGEALAAAGRVALGISAETQPDSRYVGPPRAAPMILGPGVSERLTTYVAHVGNVPLLDAGAAGRGVLNSGPVDQVVRRVPLVVSIQGVPVPSLGLEALRLAADGGIRLDRIPGGLLRLRLDVVDTLLQADGTTWLRYSPHSHANAVPAAQLFSGDVIPDLIRNKIVLVGVSGLGLLDFKTTPLGEFIPGVFVHGQVAENLLSGIWLVRPEWAEFAEAGALLLLGLLLVVFIPRVSAFQGLNVAIGMVVVLVGAGIIAFVHYSVLLDPVGPALGTLAVWGSVVVGTLSETERQRRQLREQALRMSGEVDAARRIQMGLLPDPKEVLGHDRRFQIAALLRPARTVGGDFYDCFMIDTRRLFFIVADVSGKGLPAALFMAAAKSHIKAAALREREVGEALTRAQEEIQAENPEQLFVTAFAAVLDVQTGLVEFANAGHEPPFRRRPDGSPERMPPPSGPPLCVVDAFVYPTDRLQLVPGEWLMLVSDGVTEAMDPARTFFGVGRLRASLSWMAREAAPGDLVRRIDDDVRKFAAGAEAADDLTLLALRWEGPRA